MEYRKFGNTELLVSETGFGAWAIGGNATVGGTAIGWGPADDGLSQKAIYSALDAGINFFDTADFYGLGHSEIILGKALGKSDSLIATKVGHRALNDKIVLDYSYDHIINACEESLRRLNRETIDYYQLHSARLAQLEQGDCIRAMEDLKTQGKIRYWGLSLNTFQPGAEAEWMIKNRVGSGFQLVYNLINQRAAPIIDLAAREGYGIIARMPLQFGLLTGKFSRSQQFSADDHRHFRLTPDILEQSLDILENEVWPLAGNRGDDPVSFALGFILSHPGVSTVIPGIRTPEHVQQNIRHSHLDPQSLAVLRKLGEEKWEALVQKMEKLG